MTPAEHYREAERRLDLAQRLLADACDVAWADRHVRFARVHATLATVHPTIAAQTTQLPADLRPTRDRTFGPPYVGLDARGTTDDPLDRDEENRP